MTLTPLQQRRWSNFRANGRAWWSLWLFGLLFFVSLFAEIIANDKPLLITTPERSYYPLWVEYTELDFGGDFDARVDYRDPYIVELIEEREGRIYWPLIPFSYDTINFDLDQPAPSPPTGVNWLGTDDQGRDVVARLIYGFRISVLFALVLTLASSVIGIVAGAMQGYYGGRL